MANKLSELLSCLEPKVRQRRRKSSEEYYDSEMGNDALAADMFDLAMIEDELATPTER